jgi:hypothetical protein
MGLGDGITPDQTLPAPLLRSVVPASPMVNDYNPSSILSEADYFDPDASPWPGMYSVPRNETRGWHTLLSEIAPTSKIDERSLSFFDGDEADLPRSGDGAFFVS